MSTEITSISDELKGSDSYLGQVLAELESVQDNHRLILIVASAFIDELVKTLSKRRLRYCREFKGLSVSQKLNILAESGHISRERRETLKWVRDRRNDAAHSTLFVLNKSHMPNWADKEHKDPTKLFSLCAQIIGSFWNEHVEFFREEYPLR